MDGKPLIRMYEELDIEQLAELFRKAPEQTRKGLELLIKKNPRDAIEIVPQAFDQQTGFYAKRYFEEKLLPERLREAISADTPISYVLIDIDNLKQINRHGHQFGDEAVSRLVDLINKNFRLYGRREKPSMPTQENRKNADRRKYSGKFDSIARIEDYEPSSGRVGYGDEFALLLYGCDANTAKMVMEKFLENVRDNLKIRWKKREINITISAGIAEYFRGLSPRELIARADNALYQAKSSGKNKVEIYKPEIVI